MAHEPEKSGFAMVATKPANTAGQPAAEQSERRAGTGRISSAPGLFRKDEFQYDASPIPPYPVARHATQRPSRAVSCDGSIQRGVEDVVIPEALTRGAPGGIERRRH
jgi:hypothetical protein